uniref:Uncharacterized protein n=1 Tax=Panagrolaimus superbus TaxID=310955 RepID=A0A914Y4S2_9BILA
MAVQQNPSLIPHNLVEAQFAYHVTNVAAENEKPLFKQLLYTIANDCFYDGPLVNLPCVFFTTTKRGNDLPFSSTYPTNAKKGSKHWRVKVPLNKFDDYDIYYCKNCQPQQVRLLLIKDKDKMFIENITDIEKLDKKDNKWLCHRDGKWYTNDYDNSKTKYFVNFVVLHDFPLTACSCPPKEQCEHWDPVQRSSYGPGVPLNRDELCETLIQQWSDAKRFKELENKKSLTVKEMPQTAIENGINKPGIGFCMYLQMLEPCGNDDSEFEALKVSSHIESSVQFFGSMFGKMYFLQTRIAGF